MAITVQEMNECGQQIEALRSEENVIGLQKKEVTHKLELVEARMLEMLQESGLKQFKSSVGLFSITNRTSVTTPKSDEDKAAFYEFLKSIGMFDSMISVHSAKLNAFYKAQFEEAIAQGKEDFSIPGITGETITAILSFRKS